MRWQTVLKKPLSPLKREQRVLVYKELKIEWKICVFGISRYATISCNYPAAKTDGNAS